MNGNDLLDAFAGIGEKYIVRYETAKAGKSGVLAYAVPAAACIALSAVAAFAVSHGKPADGPFAPVTEQTATATGTVAASGDRQSGEPAENTAETETAFEKLSETDYTAAAAPASETAQTADGTETETRAPITPTDATTAAKDAATAGGELAVTPRWDERTDPERYGGLIYRGKEYSVGRNAIDAGYLKESLGTAECVGYDIYEDANLSMTVNVCRLDGVSDECAVGVRFADGTCFAYVEPRYTPSTLGQFLEDANLYRQIRFGKAYCSIAGENGGRREIIIENIDDGYIRSALLSDVSAANTEPRGRKIVTFGVSVPELGYENQSFALTDEGYITTNILESGKAFFIGKEKADGFVEYLLGSAGSTEINTAAATDGEEE